MENRFCLTPTAFYQQSFWEQFSEAVEEKFVPLGDTQNGNQLVEYFLQKPASWVITVDNTPVGLLALSHPHSHPEYYQTSTYLLAPHRGKRYSQLLKHVVAQSFRHHPHLKLCVIVRGWNGESFKAMSKAFPEICPVQQERAVEQRIADPEMYQWFWDLSDVAYNEEIVTGFSGLVEPVLHWLQGLRVSSVDDTILVLVE